MKKVSVIIPVYNGEKYIKESINSVLNQTYKNLELIIVNDASTDKTEEVIFENFKNLIGNRIIYYKNEKNMERVYSRNKGVELSSGDFIYFLDYDDLFRNDYIEKTVNYLEEFDLVYSIPRTFIDEKRKVLRISKKKFDSIEKIVFSGNIGYPSATAFKRKSFIEYKEKYLFREDWEIFIRAYISDLKIKLLDNDLVLMREHPNRTSRNIKFLMATYRVYEDYKNKIPKNYLGNFLFHIGETALRYGDLLKGWQLVLKAFANSPSLLKNRRIILSLLKRGFRIDRALKYKNSF